MFSKKQNIEVIDMQEEKQDEKNDIITINNDLDSKSGPELTQKKGKFVKGYDPRRNLAGRPPSGTAIAEKTRAVLKSPSDPSDPNSPLVEDIILEHLSQEAVAGNLSAVQILLNRAYGNTQQAISVEVIPEAEVDLSIFSDEELNLYLALVEKSENGTTEKYYELMEKATGKPRLEQMRD